MQTTNTPAIVNTSLAPKNLSPAFFVHTDLSKELFISEAELVTANRCYPKVIDCEKTELFSKIKTLVNKCFKDTRFVKDVTAQDILDISLTVADDILREFPHATYSEIEIAFRKGCREDYGDFMGLSAVTFYKWLRYFYSTDKNEERKQALAKQRKHEDEQEILRNTYKPTKEEEKIFSYFALISLAEALEDEENEYTDIAFSDYKNTKYVLLQKFGVIPNETDKKQKEKIEAAAKKSLEAKANAEIKRVVDPLKKQEIRDRLKKDKPAFEAECRKIHMKRCLKDYIKKNTVDNYIHLLQEKLIGEVKKDNLIWDALRLKIKRPEDFFTSQKQYDAFLKKNEQLIKEKPRRA